MAWYEDFFDENYIKTYIHLDRERTSKDVDFIGKALEISKENLILDIPCGFGRHSIELTGRGYHVTGMEYNSPQIDEAKKLMKETGMDFEIIKADMRDIPHKNKYDKIFNFFTSFGYFSDEENEKTMESFYNALKPGGMLLIEMVNRDGILKNYQKSSITRLCGGELLLEERNYDPLTGRMHSTHSYINKKGDIKERKFDHRMYCPYELIEMCKRHNFEVIKVLGDDGEDFKIFSRRLSVVCRKL
jgi:SAM-dependent methyltransferase